jgi:hypothetical protein
MNTSFLLAAFAALAITATVGCAAPVDPSSDDTAESAEAVTASSVTKKLGALESSVSGAQIDENTDYGRSFSVTKYAKGTDTKKILSDVTGYNQDDINLGGFSNSAGRDAIKDVADTIYREAKELETNDDEAAAKTLKAVSRDLYALQGSVAAFKSIKSYSHSIAEDGDLQSDTLIFTKTDGSLVVFAYTNFPF